jgi:hypothetical protein
VSDDFTYTPPNENRYLRAVLAMLKKKGYYRLFDILKTSRCSINLSGTYSRKRSNAIYTTITFLLPMDIYETLDIENEDNFDRKTLFDICNRVMPLEAGLDITGVDVVPLLDTTSNNKAWEDDLKDMRLASKKVSTNFVLPTDIVENAYQMAEVYLHLYMAENYLRLFIEKVSIQKFGSNFFDRLNITESLKKVVMKRKRQEDDNKWMRVRVSSDVFYLDFRELAILLQNNWDLFKTYFPDQMWIISRIDELVNCRKLVSHNSSLIDKERDAVSVHFRNLVKQIHCLI